MQVEIYHLQQYHHNRTLYQDALERYTAFAAFLLQMCFSFRVLFAKSLLTQAQNIKCELAG